MHYLKALVSTLLLSAAGADAKSAWSQKRWYEEQVARRQAPRATPKVTARDSSNSTFLTKKTQKFYVPGTSLPDVTFDAGESYSGSLPNDENGDLFFWFWPTTADDAPKEILLWLNGGPGCSSLDGFFKENGAVIWPTGAPYPVTNPWSYHHLTNVIYVEQPVGTGYSKGNVTATSEEDVARQFMGFWKNFIDTFAMHGYKVYITGESYAGMYCPYIAQAMLEQEDNQYFKVKGVMINDPVIGPGELTQASANYFYQNWKSVIPLNDTYAAALSGVGEGCNYNNYTDTYLTFPALGKQPDVDKLPAATNESCDPQGMIIDGALRVNPGFNLYEVSQLPPVAWDVIGFPYSNEFEYPGEQIYFDRQDVRAAIHAPTTGTWDICQGPVFVRGDKSDPSSFRAIPAVLERTNNVMINHGTLDFVLTANATLLAIQNMTWNGGLGLKKMPTQPLFVPYNDESEVPTAAGAGVMGSWGKERGLTVGLVTLTGHMIPEWVPGVSFRQIQYLLGRIDSLSSTEPFPQWPSIPQPKASELGAGTAGTNWGRVVKK